MLQNCFFLTESHNPDLPNETWTLVSEAIGYSIFYFLADWGKYRIEYSGGGGSGSSVAFRYTENTTRSQENGFNGNKFIITDNVMSGYTKTYTGSVGAGAKGSHTYARDSYHERYAGDPGIGFENGNYGTTAGISDEWQVAAGSGGGSTSFYTNAGYIGYARGGDGGSASITHRRYYNGNWVTDSRSTIGGTGGNGGTRTGTGSPGGAASYGKGSSSSNTSGAGADGYIRVYKSNLKPEPI